MSEYSGLMRRTKTFLSQTWVLFILAVLLAFAVRTYVCNRELASIKSQTGADFYPFFVESSIMYGFAKDVGSGKGIPAYDHSLAGMDKIKVSEQMPLGIEYFLGYSWRIAKLFFGEPSMSAADKVYEDDPAGAAFMRNTIRLWASCWPAKRLPRWGAPKGWTGSRSVTWASPIRLHGSMRRMYP